MKSIGLNKFIKDQKLLLLLLLSIASSTSRTSV